MITMSLDVLDMYNIFASTVGLTIVLFILYEIIKERKIWDKIFKGAFILFAYATMSFLAASITLTALGLLYGTNPTINSIIQTLFLLGFLLSLLIMVKIRNYLALIRF